jgi:CBS domain-containing protein
MFIVKDILSEKGYQVVTASPETSVGAALQLMADKQIGALVVVEDEKPVGVFSERDFARRVIRYGCSLETPIQELMTSPVITVEPMQSFDDCMTLMTDKSIRHLPVVERGRLVGIISIGDVVRAVIYNRERNIRKLERYIDGTDYGR